MEVWVVHMYIGMYACMDGCSAITVMQVTQHSVYCVSSHRELLSSQQHYDWGLRALKSVLSVAGSLLKAEKKKQSTGMCVCAMKKLRVCCVSCMSW